MIARERFLAILIAATFLIGGVIGGGPTSASLAMFVELAGCFLSALALAGLIDGHFPRSATSALVLLTLICLVPLAQLIPLPPSMWEALPGHKIPGAISRLAGLAREYRPLSLTPEQTKLAALTLIVPAAIFAAALQLDMRSRDNVMKTIVAFALISALFGAFQAASGGRLDLSIYPQVHDGYPIGFFANRNHEADLLLIAMPFSGHLIRLQRWPTRGRNWAMAIAIAFLILSVIATQSRSGFTLLPLAIAGTLLIWIGDIRDRQLWRGVALLAVLVLITYGIAKLTPVGNILLHRFSDRGGDQRSDFWQASWIAIRDFWPMGSGTGSFVPVYDMYEDLNSVNTAWVNHAHDDYLELLLVTGLAGAVLIAGYAITMLLALRRSLPGPCRSQRYAAVFAILILLAHSLTDYPLRTFALISIFAFASALLYPARDALRMRLPGSYPISPAPAFAGVLDRG